MTSIDLQYGSQSMKRMSVEETKVVFSHNYHQDSYGFCTHIVTGVKKKTCEDKGRNEYVQTEVG
jgi:hypothetical protein